MLRSLALSNGSLPAAPHAESYVDDNKRVKWCPSVPHCGHAIRSKEMHCEVCVCVCVCD